MRAARPATLAAGLAVVLLAGGLTAVFAIRTHTPPMPICVLRGPTHAAAPAPRPRPRSAAPLRLRLRGDGTVAGVTEGGPGALPAVRGGGGFSARLVGGTPNLLSDPGFEADANGDGSPDGWTISPGEGTIGSDGTVAHSGIRSVRITLGATGRSGSATTTIAVHPATYYVASAWFRSQDVRPTAVTAFRDTNVVRSPLQLEVDQLRAGSVVATARAYGYTDTAGWNRQFVGFLTGPGVRTVRVAGLIARGSGTAWLDDVSVSELLRPGPVAVTGRARPVHGGTLLTGTVDRLGIPFTATLRPVGKAVRVDGAVGPAPAGSPDRAFQVTFTLPVNARGWQWGDYARRSRAIVAGTYSYESETSLQTVSRYPWGAIWDPRYAVAIGVPLDQPRIFRVRYVTGVGLSITFDLASSPSVMGGRATFSFVLYPFDPAWGFRSATQAYYDLFPGSFLRRTDPACEGAWFVAPPIESIDATYRDFGLGLDMIALGKASSQRHDTWGTKYLGWDNQRRIATTAYNHHWAYYDPLPEGSSALPTYRQAVAKLQAEARVPPSSDEAAQLRDEASATLLSGARDQNGRLYYERYGDSLAYYVNADPDPSAPNDWARALGREQVGRALALARRAGGTLDAIHLDSTSGMRRWGAADDYDRAHWARARIPLTFSYDSGLAALRGVFPIYDNIAATADFVHARGMFLSANYNADENRAMGFIGANLIDYFGLEQGLEDRTPAGVTTDQFALMKRTLADQRPVSTLDHKIGDGQLTPVEIDGRLQTNLFYGIFSGAFNALAEADASSGRVTWSTETNAALWARYSPIFRELAEAGWEPVTAARSSNPSVWVERFGSLASGDLHLTLRNQTGRTQRTAIVLDLAAAGAGAATLGLRATEEVGRTPLRVSVQRGAGQAQVVVTVPPRSTRVLSIVPAP